MKKFEILIKILILKFINFFFQNFFNDFYKEFDGKRIYLKKGDTTSLRIKLDTFEKMERELLKYLIQKNDIFLDIGCNVGIYSLELYDKCKSILAFDLIEEHLQLINKSITYNGIKNIKSFKTALGSKNINKINIISHHHNSLSRVSETNKFEKNSPENINVEMIKLDDFLIQHNIKPESSMIVKIDVEGYEYEVIKGFNYFLNANSPRFILIEIVDEFLKRYDSSKNSLIKLLESKNYKLVNDLNIRARKISFPIHNNYLFKLVKKFNS